MKTCIRDRGYIKETEVESRIDSQKKTWEAEKGKEYNDLKQNMLT